MKLSILNVALSLVSLLTITACGNGVDDDPLAGTWSNSGCFGAASKPADIESCNTELSFGNDLSIELKTETISLAATATNPGCTTTRLVTGQQWSTDHAEDTFTVTGSGTTTLERTNCVNDADNMPPTATTEINIPDGDTTYTLAEDTLSIMSGSLNGTYTR
jgi:hypothetical protein